MDQNKQKSIQSEAESYQNEWKNNCQKLVSYKVWNGKYVKG